MISETKRHVLAAACGLERHENASNIYHPMACSCGWERNERCNDEVLYDHIKESNLTFSTPDDWELVRVNVVVPHLNAFCAYAAHIVKSPIPYGDIVVAFEWFLTLSPEECCEIAANFILANLSLFLKEVQEKTREIGKEQV